MLAKMWFSIPPISSVPTITLETSKGLRVLACPYPEARESAGLSLEQAVEKVSIRGASNYEESGCIVTISPHCRVA